MEYGTVTQTIRRRAAPGDNAGIAGNLSEMIAVFRVAHRVDFLKVAFLAGVEGKSRQRLHLKRVLAPDPGPDALQMRNGVVAIIVVAQPRLMEFPNQSGIHLKLLCGFLRRFQLAVVIIFFQSPAFRQYFLTAHKYLLLCFRFPTNFSYISRLVKPFSPVQTARI